MRKLYCENLEHSPEITTDGQINRSRLSAGIFVTSYIDMVQCGIVDRRLRKLG